MKRLLILAAFLAAGAPVHADLSDSGDLIIGGQGIISGTMTVKGNAFSVGGSTFSVAGGSVTLGGRLNAATAGIKWADGTTSTSASGGASASYNVVVASVNAVQTVSGTDWVHLTGSSVSINTTGTNRLLIIWNGEIGSASALAECRLKVLLNGADLSTNIPVLDIQSYLPVASMSNSHSAVLWTKNLTAGNQNISVMVSDHGAGTCLYGQSARWHLTVQEIPGL